MGKPIDLALSFACRAAAEETRGILLSHDVISFSVSGFLLRINIAAQYAVSVVTILVGTSLDDPDSKWQ